MNMADYLHWDTQGPCPDGYHVPTSNDWKNIVDAGISLGAWILSNGDRFRIRMKMPFAGYRQYYMNVQSVGAYGRYWASNISDDNYSRYLSFGATHLSYTGGEYRACGFSIRPFKNIPVVPNDTWTTIYQGTGNAGIFHSPSLGLISVSSDGTTWYTIADKNLGATTVYTDGATLSEANCGKFYQWGNNYGFPFAGDISKYSQTLLNPSIYGPGKYYSSDTYIYPSTSPYDWMYVVNANLRGGVTDTRPEEPEHLKKAGIYWNETLGLISLSNGDGNWITIADKNLGATTAYKYGYGQTAKNCGNWYQWGNNYGFPYKGTLTTSSTRVSASSYGPGNYYNSSTFITDTSYWDTSYNGNLWGDKTDTLIARKGPCPTGFHIPTGGDAATDSELKHLHSVLTGLLGSATIKMHEMGEYLLMPEGTYRQGNSVSYGGRYWSSTPYSDYYAYVISLDDSSGNTYFYNSGNVRSLGGFIRPFANLPVEPDYTWTKLYGEDIPGPTPPTPTTLNKYITKLYHLGKEYIFDERISTTGINVSPTSINLTKLNQTAQITASVIPTNADDKKIIYTSSAPSIVSVSSTGLVKALGEGNATITVKSNDGGFSKSVSVVSNFGWQPGANTLIYIPDNIVNKQGTYTGNFQGTGTIYSGRYNGVDCTWMNTGLFKGATEAYFGTLFTVSAWIYRDGQTFGGLYGSAKTSNYSSYSGFTVSINGDNKLAICGNNSGTKYSTSTIPDKTRCNIIISVSGSTVKAYLNGNSIFSDTITRAETSRYPVICGTSLYHTSGSTTDSRANGYFADYIVENKARTATEISDYYNQTKSKYGK